MVLCGGSSKPIQRKIVILGDGACGKTSLLNVFTRGYFPHVYEPTVFENYMHDIFIDGKQVQLSLWDTAGQEEFDKLRSLSYNDTDCVILCFSVDSPDSLQNVKNKWVNEVLEHCEGIQMVLVALKADLRQTEDEDRSTAGINSPMDAQQQQFGTSAYNSEGMLKKLVSYEEGLAMAKKIGAVRYLECSSIKKRGVNEVFTEAARVALASKSKADEEQSSSGGCVVM
ncbi:Rho GTPase [Brettanomyces bruxellensis]|uniref:GTP-binding protein RHO3 n=1 Tax=Dekkera bruxellensis TaxID=5007 RepID=A0A7D9GZX6_DEKBR|nr:Rho GTPase [Brettanomyces bruxellensis]VUG18140.1 RHO3 [Brettanomyces bruxellensis]